MSKRLSRISVLSLIVLMIACGGAPPESPGQAAAGAGTVLRADPALDEIVPSDYKIEKLHGGFLFTEGPVWIPAASPFLLFSDVRGNVIYKWTPDGALTDFLKPVFEGDYPEGRSVSSNGLTLDAKGRLIVCEHGHRRISRMSPTGGEREVLADRYQGKRLNSPNDAVFHSAGYLYFTDPPYGLVGQDDDPDKELDFNGIFRLSPGGELELLNDKLTRPNGIAFSPDEKTLYVANSDPERKIWMAYGVNDDGTLDEGRLFYDVTSDMAEGLPDGLKVDRQGNLYCTGPGGVWIFSPDGNHLGTIQAAEVPANVGWGGADGTTLYMTARTGLYRVNLLIEGIRP